MFVLSFKSLQYVNGFPSMCVLLHSFFICAFFVCASDHSGFFACIIIIFASFLILGMMYSPDGQFDHVHDNY